MTTDEKTMREALQTALSDALEADDDVFLLGEDIADPMGGSYKITAGLSTRFGTERVRNTPIAEAAIVGAAIGASLVGKRPVAEIMYIDFLTVAMDQVVNQAAFLSYMSGGQVSVPIVIRCQGGGHRSSAAQHSKSLEAWFAHVPGLKFFVPSGPEDAYWLLRAAIDDNSPVIFYEPNELYSMRGMVDTTTPPADVTETKLVRQGKHATIVSWGTSVGLAAGAADKLEAEGISAEVLALRSLAPLDCTAILESVAKTGLLCVVHEAWETCGVGAEIAAQISDRAFGYLDGPIKRVAALHTPHPFSPILESEMLPSEDDVVRAVRSWFDLPADSEQVTL